MFNALDRVRKKPRIERRAIAFSIAAVITGVIFIVWIISFFASIQNDQKTITPSESGFGFDAFVNSFQEASNVIQQEVGAAREQFVNLSSDKFTPGGASNELQKVEENNSSNLLPDTIVTKKEEIFAVEEKEIKTEITSSGIEIIQVEELFDGF